MEQVFSFDFPQLSTGDKVLLRRAIRGQKVQVLSSILDKVNSPDISEKLGEHTSDLRRFWAELIFHSKQNPDLFWQIADHWATSLLLSRLLNQYGGTAEADTDKLISNLNGLLLFERLLNGSPDNTSASYITHTDNQGRLHGLMHDTSLKFHDERFREKRVQWDFTSDEVTVYPADLSAPEFTLSLPIEENSYFKFLPLINSKVADLPIFDESNVWGSSQAASDEGDKNPDQNGHNSLPLKMEESLSGAQEIIKELWPEALEWIDSIIPAFVDMGIPPNGTARISSSYNPGAPIFLGRVGDPFDHAEDVIHEVQHHRLLMVAGISHFKSWIDVREIYISPYRQDPRPMRGLILGIHAFLTVNELKKRMISRGHASKDLIQQMVDIHYKNLFTYRTIIEHDEFGDFGKELFKQMGRVLSEHHSFIRSVATPDLERAAEQRVQKHVGTFEEGISEIKNADSFYRNWDETARLAANFG